MCREGFGTTYVLRQDPRRDLGPEEEGSVSLIPCREDVCLDKAGGGRGGLAGTVSAFVI